MKRFLALIVLAFGLTLSALAQNALNNNADNIVGTYFSTFNGESYKVKVVRLEDGTYRGQVIWVEHDLDAQGNKLLDIKNPDKSLRNTPTDRIVLFSGLRYDAKKHRWGGTKMYDSRHGISVNMSAQFTDDDRLRIKGTLMGVGMSIYWEKMQ